MSRETPPINKIERYFTSAREAGLSDAALAPPVSASGEAIDTEMSGVQTPVGHKEEGEEEGEEEE